MVNLWPHHPRYLDCPGLGGVNREAQTVQTVIFKGANGYSNHPKVKIFSGHPQAKSLIARYRLQVYAEAQSREYFGYDLNKISMPEIVDNRVRIEIQENDYLEQWNDLKARIEKRSPEWFKKIKDVEYPEPSPVFKVVS